MNEICTFLDRTMPPNARYFVGVKEKDLMIGGFLSETLESKQAVMDAPYWDALEQDGFLWLTFHDEILLDACALKEPPEEPPFEGEESADNPSFLYAYRVRRILALCRFHEMKIPTAVPAGTARRLAVRLLLSPLLYRNLSSRRRLQNRRAVLEETEVLYRSLRFSQKDLAPEILFYLHAAAHLLCRL